MNEQPAGQQQEKSLSGAGVGARLDPISAPKAESGSEQQKARNFRESLERSKLYIELLVAACAIAGLFAVYWQLGEMKETNRLTRESLQTTRESNKSSGEETKRTQELMAESNRLTREALEESKRQSEASRKQSAADAEASRIQSAQDAAANLRLARESMNKSRSALEITQRARLIIARLDSRDAMDSSSIKVFVQNTGAAVATEVRANIHYVMAPSSAYLPEIRGFPLDYPASVLPEGKAVIGSGAVAEFHAGHDTLKEAAPYSIPFVYGVVRYLDGFDHDRTLTFCFYYTANARESDWRPCYAYNQAD